MPRRFSTSNRISRVFRRRSYGADGWRKLKQEAASVSKHHPLEDAGALFEAQLHTFAFVCIDVQRCFAVSKKVGFDVRGTIKAGRAHAYTNQVLARGHSDIHGFVPGGRSWDDHVLHCRASQLLYVNELSVAGNR